MRGSVYWDINVARDDKERRNKQSLPPSRLNIPFSLPVEAEVEMYTFAVSRYWFLEFSGENAL